MWTYSQPFGDLSKDGVHIGVGYSGFGAGKNNPALQEAHDIGPIPLGRYSIGPPHDTAAHGPHVMALTPAAGTDMFGRAGFLIHGDSIANPGAGSHGCIVLAPAIRHQISISGDTQLEVVGLTPESKPSHAPLIR